MGFTRCFRALCRRNLIFRKRRWLSSFFEFILPIAAFGILVSIKGAVENTDRFKPEIIPAKIPKSDDVLIGYSFLDYLTVLGADKRCVPGYGQSGFTITGIDPLNNPTPFVRCDSRQCQYPGEDALPYCEFSILALAPSSTNDTLAGERLDEFTDWLGDTYPQLLDASKFPFDHFFVQRFPSVEMIDAYVTHPDYGKTEYPKVSVAVVFESTSGLVNEYNYVLRVNSTGFNSPENEGRPASPTTPSTSRLFNSFAKTPQEACALQGGAPFVGYFGSSCVGQYLYNGALPIQRLVNDYIFDATGSAEKGAFVAENGVSFVNFPEPSYVKEGFYSLIANFVPLLVVLGLLYPISACIRSIVQEKELRQKELMKMMSVSESAISWSWFVCLYAFLFLSGIVTTIVASSLYVHSDFVLLLIFWSFSLLGSLMFAFVIAACFSRATRATLVGILLFFAGFFLTLAVDYKEDSPGAVFAVSLHPVTSFSYGLQLIGDLEDKGVGLRGSTQSFSDFPSGLTFRNIMSSLIFDCIFWGILSWYLNRVLKGDYGQPLPWYFMFTKSYWFPTRLQDIDSLTDDEPLASSIPTEDVSEALRSQANQVQICGISRAFGEKLAVDSLNLSMYSGQVTALLGHNGAGKTTTINMLTGMLSPSSGYAKVAGYDIRTQMPLIREKLGICLQHDCLFPLLTVKEHVEFFSRIKGVYDSMPQEDAESSVVTAIEDVALAEKRNTLSKDLSGGMKRKLSVAIAFCGNSQTVFLDEPTSGMDPFSRRFVWNLIRQYRENRCIILTTHFMDEADLLGDRIAIMAEGQLRCVGSSLFLKREFGVGYNLTVAKISSNGLSSRNSRSSLNSNGMDDDVEKGINAGSLTIEKDGSIDDEITGIVKNAVSDSSLLSNVGNEISFQLPLAACNHFPDMLTKLDALCSEERIFTYGLGITTLEEVFLMVARGETGKRKNLQKLNSQPSVPTEGDTSSIKQFRSDAELQQQFSRHVQALFAKRATNFKRDKKAWCCSTICPSFFALIGFMTVAMAPVNRNMSLMLLKLDDNNPEVLQEQRNPIPFNQGGNSFSCRPGKCIGFTDGVLFGDENFVCGQSAVFGFDSNSSNMEGYSGPNCTITASNTFLNEVVDVGAYPVPQNTSSIQDASSNLIETSTLFESTQYGALYFTHDTDSLVNGDAETAVKYNDAVYTACVEREQDPAECERFSGIGYTVSTNFTSLHAPLLYQAIADEAIIRSAIQNPDISINPAIHPLPITSAEEAYISGEDSFMAWFLLVVSFPFITGAFGTFVVAERQSKAKHLQTVSGVKPWAYWLSTYAWDTLNYQLPLWIVVIFIYATGLEALITNERGVASGTISTLFLFGPASAGFTYCVSFLFKSPSMCNLFIIVFGFIIGMVPAIVTFILRLIAADPSGDLSHFLTIAQSIEWVLRFFPPFNMAKGLFFITNIETISIIYAKPDITVWDSEVLLYEIIFLAIQCILYIALAVSIDKMSNKPRYKQALRSFLRFATCHYFGKGNSNIAPVTYFDEEDPADQPDEDVMFENERVFAGDADRDLITIKDLSKVYDNGKRAVDHLSLGVPPGECFGLLGINGAGKTTTMAMLTAEFPPTTGDAFLDSFSVTHQPEQTRQRIGYCPQFDAHFMNMTGKEHVELYGSIKGIPQEFVKEAASAKLAQVGLNEFDSNRLSATYSGGMKRKLSVACATIGEPATIFLDEPSTGMDPLARRDLWRVISQMVSGDKASKTSVILTTHSMEECEALCPRIGIMAGGKLQCLGSAQQLKSRFGHGFQIEAKVKDALQENHDYKETKKALLNYFQGSSRNKDCVYIKLDKAIEAVDAITNNSDIASMICEDNPIGYVIYRNASSESGIALDELTSFCVQEMRLDNLKQFCLSSFSSATLRERQENKVRYEVSSEALKISSVFGIIEEHKDKLQLQDYGVSQTSLEQVFNQFAAKAEERKQGGDDK